jgi:hypothetical protein
MERKRDTNLRYQIPTTIIHHGKKKKNHLIS